MRPPLAARRLALAAALLLGHAAVAAAQAPIGVTGVQGVTFGTMLQGATKVISRADAANAAQFTIKAGGGGRQVQLQFTLPSNLVGPGGAAIPLSYGAGDAGFSAQQSIANQVGFDPRSPVVVQLSQNGRGSVFLGCRATPGAAQPPGTYTATLTLTVIYFP
jgi:hypothetical protein